jgi:deoxyadenosine/deoxycytidine kinase
MVGRRFKLSKFKRVEIAGGIASGKTTLARLLRFVGLKPVHEKFKQNPFYTVFYEDPIGTALETEITFLLQHYHAEKQFFKKSSRCCADFSMLLDRAYAAVTLPSADQRIFELISARLERDLPGRSLTIYLDCSAPTKLRRIKRRDRVAERGITLEYLTNVDTALRRLIRKVSNAEDVLVIDSGEIDFAHRSDGIAYVVSEVGKALGVS